MGSAVFANNAASTLSASITSTATAIVVASGQGALFPATTGGNYFYVTLVNASNQIEIVKCTARSVDTLTVVRGQEGTTARAYSAGDKIELRVTAAALNSKLPVEGGAITGSLSIAGSLTAPTFTGNVVGNVTGNVTGNASGTAANVTGIVAVANGGTGAGTAADARTNLGLGPLATAATVNNGNWSGAALTVTNGGTGATDAPTARSNLGLGTLATKTTINNADWSGTALALANGGTGATDAVTARSNLGLASLATKSTINNGDWSGTALSIANGGTGAATAADAFAALAVAAQDLSAQGYVKLQNGLTLMWGSSFVSANGSTAVSYPAGVSLTSFSRAVVSGGTTSTSEQDNAPAVIGCTTTGFTVFSALNVGATVFWIAVGV